jgi:hypothetical protein
MIDLEIFLNTLGFCKLVSHDFMIYQPPNQQHWWKQGTSGQILGTRSLDGIKD